jgi:hemerythrin-like domain-containing protein/enamine deaminase RidA (YjgF/YER057c/UK114 family)
MWECAVVSSILQTLHADHVNIGQLLKLIEEQVEQIDTGNPDSKLETLTLVLEYCLEYPGKFHHPTEDMIYQRLLSRAPHLSRKITVLTADHKTLSQLIWSFGDAVAQALDGGEIKPVQQRGLEFVRYYRRHMHLEEGEIFPAAKTHLTPDDWSQIEATARGSEDQLSTQRIREAYKALKDRILARAAQNSNHPDKSGDKNMAGQIDARLVELGIELPQAAAAVANYVPYVIDGGQVWIAGQVPFWNGAVKYTGSVGDAVSLDDAIDAARVCALNILAQAKAALGDLDRVTRIVKLGGFVNAVPGFTDYPKVINGASDLMVEIFGDKGMHARSAVGAAGLPLGVPVEIDAVIAFT